MAWSNNAARTRWNIETRLYAAKVALESALSLLADMPADKEALKPTEQARRWVEDAISGNYILYYLLGEYVRDGVTTNGVESVFAVLKRGLIGVYHHASPKHLGRYVNEFAFRLNDGDVKRHTLDRLNSFIIASAGRRLTYKALVA